MDGNTIPNTVDFSDVPALGDEQGLNTFLQNEALAAQGMTPTNTSTDGGTPTASEANTTGAPAAQATSTVQGTAPASTAGVSLTQEQMAQIVANVQRINANLQQPVQKPVTLTYSDQERAFINHALAQGYGLDQINATILRHRTGGNNQAMAAQNAALAQQVEQIKQYLQTQEYQNAQNAFISKLSSFGDKFGLSEQDLVTFGNEAYKKGINIALPNVDFETVFRAVYPDQYRIRMQRMAPTNASQIYGGTSIPESGNRAAASRMEDAYVDSFLKQAMPNQFQMNKK